MRVFSFQHGCSTGGPGLRVPRLPWFLLAAACLLAAPAPVASQWPAELSGRVVDAVSDQPVEGAVVEVVGTGRSATTDGAGRFRLRGLEPGRASLRVRRLGYRTHEGEVELGNGRSVRVEVALRPEPLALEGLAAEAARGARRSRGGVRIDRAEVERSGARTAGDLLREVPGVMVRERGSGGAQTVSIRGSSADAVLVLVDGAPLNDPVTGEADLSTVPAASVERVMVLPGARTARYGGRARAGAVVIETRAPLPGLAARAAAGSLGFRAAAGEVGGTGAGVRWGGGAAHEAQGGRFTFRRSHAVGGGIGRRRNADLERWSGWASVDGAALGGEAAARVGLETLERGLPGRSFAPSDSARQSVRRLRLSARWWRVGRDRRLDLSAYSTLQRTRFRDPAPPLGLPYDDRTDVAFTGLGGQGARVVAAAGGEGLVSAGLELRHAALDAGGLSDRAPAAWTDGGAFTQASLGWPDASGAPEVDATVRLDRDGTAGRWHLSHELAVRGAAGPFSAHVAHRSGFSPPSLGDQFFREGVGVRPNPELRGERVPSEIEAGVEVAATGSRARVSAGVAAFAADVRDMIVWTPDFRFVWSPRNLDVERRGLDAWLDLELGMGAGGRLALGSHYALARVTYADPARQGLQLLYRPRHTGSGRLTWSSAGSGARVSLVARYTGARLPTPSPANELRPFWTVDLRAERAWSRGPWTVRARLVVDRLLDSTDALIFAYPDPGRTVELGVRLERGRP